ncbi:MAG TPA: YcaO-like family protein, partial [Anaeromyxobacteraceae bacterium]|nr:YcaO-like family protein [Anaeromyxobacteraceae bacterium]
MPGSGPVRERRRARLAAALGVTRVARLTGLDRTGVEVAAAVRPGGHVLQVSTGKGETFEAAAAGALAEAAELVAAERPGPLLHATAEELRARLGPGALLAPRDLAPSEAPPAWERLRLAWQEAVDLGSGRPCLVPAQAVHCPPAGAPPLGLSVLPWTSNGMGAHRSRDAALVHALLEACERDQLARALPRGFTAAEVRRRLLAPGSLGRAAPRTAAWAARLAARGFAVHLLDLTADLGLPVAGALVADDGGPVPLAAGYACRLGRDEALLAALLEAAQSRLTEIHGAREDVLHGERDAAEPLARWCRGARPSRRASALPDHRARSPRAALRLLLARL